MGMGHDKNHLLFQKLILKYHKKNELKVYVDVTSLVLSSAIVVYNVYRIIYELKSSTLIWIGLVHQS